MNQPARRAVAITSLAAAGLGLTTAQILNQPEPSDHRDPGVVLNEEPPASSIVPEPAGATSSPAPENPAPIGDVATGAGQPTGVGQQPTVPVDDDADDKDDDKDVKDDKDDD
ncbi:hypothetical protein HMPREF1531_00446 [Propionibacterium sp. oral taxon 192 str. F0372]|uniref:hypothetical protein n=1 Tax=Propionibacterium sp. oral taxon 192 TaxID=671222 RepID=UPI00035330B6|nr:hypothetical protein [Propionibacterium sp. oral taxon 192]EPH06844.1 hypothetical protein HMPREF1531_00446 [Propionibacterium sp. oral taxon 192 str. F0372]